MLRQPSIYDELYKRRRSARVPKPSTPYTCNCSTITVVDAWYATASGIYTMNTAPPSPFYQSKPCFDKAFIDNQSRYIPVFRVETSHIPSLDMSTRRWQLLEGVLSNAMQRIALPEWQNSLLVIYDPDAAEETGYLSDEWLAHWPAELRPKGGFTLASQPFLEWLAQRLTLVQDSYLYFCFVALEPLNPALASSSPGESATVLWLKRSELSSEKNSADGIALSAPTIIDKEFSIELFDNLLENQPAYDALVWDGHNDKLFKKLLKSLIANNVSNMLENDAFWSVKRMTGTLQHYDALQVALATQAAIDSPNGVIILNTHDNTKSRVTTLRRVPSQEI